MADRIIFTIDGVQYESIREFLEQHNINMHTFQMAMKQFSSEPDVYSHHDERPFAFYRERLNQKSLSDTNILINRSR